MEMPARLQNCGFYRTIISEHSSEVKKKDKRIINLPMTLVEETSYLEVAPPGHTFAYKNHRSFIKK